MKSNVTILNIAHKVGVSHTTVSRVLSGRGSEHRISEPTCKRVMHVARQLGYAPHAGAVMLKRGRSQTIAIFVRQSDEDLTSGVFSKIFTAAQSACTESGHNLVICQTPVKGYKAGKSHLDITNIPKIIRENFADAFIFAGVSAGPFQKQLSHYLSNKPCIQIMGESGLDWPNITYDAKRTGYMAAEYLWNIGHRCVSQFQGPIDSYLAGGVAIAFTKRWTQLAGLAPIDLSPEPYYVESGRKHGLQLLRTSEKGRLTAVFAGNDMAAMGFLQAATDVGWKVPHELCILGMDDVVAAQWCTPTLTTIHHQYSQMATAAVQYIIGRLDGKIFVMPKVFLPEIIERETCIHRKKMTV